MQNKLFVFLFFFSVSIFAQNASLANSYFRKGEYEKAISFYKPLHEENPIRRDYFKNLLTCYQQTEKYAFAEKLLNQQAKQFPRHTYLNVEIGYNYQLQSQNKKATTYYNKALKSIEKRPTDAFSIGQSFKQNHLLDYALQTYQLAENLDPKLNTQINVAKIYGEKGDFNNMFNSYLNLVEKNEKQYINVQRLTAVFITDDKTNNANIIFKKLLLKRSQNNPKDAWNILLSWLFMQQKEYNKAFIQEKALYHRNLNNLSEITEIGRVAFENKAFLTAQNCFLFIIKNTDKSIKNQYLILNSEIYLLQIKQKLASNQKDLNIINTKFESLINQYGANNNTLYLQIAYAHFLAYSYNQPQKAITILEKLLPFTASKFQKGEIQIKLADILVFTNQFNQALILYSQVQTELKNSTLAQTARFKVAQTSYYKGDFDWAKTQLKVLKASTSQLIANDALHLNLLITNNTVNDSVQTALKIFAKAELLAFQNKNNQAIDTLSSLLLNFKGHAIEDDALFKQAELYTTIQKYTQAENNYLKIIKNYPTSILLDNTYFQLAELYNNALNNSEKAKEMYQKIIFEFPSSIYLVEARKKYRKLRGDTI